MFGRRKQRQREQEEAAREAERRSLFEELAKRPDTVCPFLGMAEARTEYRDRVSDGHRCYAFGDPAELSAEQQQKVCLQRGYGNCPRYLRGVLVIPTEELEALRRPQPAPPPPAEPEPEVVGPPAARRGRGGLVAVVLVLLILVAGGAGTFLLLEGGLIGGLPGGTPSPSPAASATESIAVSDGRTPEPTGTSEPTATPNIVPSQSILPTPAPDDEFQNHAVVVFQGEYPVYRLNEAGEVTGTATTEFNEFSSAPVELVEGADGQRYWRTLAGTYTDLAYVVGYSDENVEFHIYEIYAAPGSDDPDDLRYRRLDEEEL